MTGTTTYRGVLLAAALLLVTACGPSDRRPVRPPPPVRWQGPPGQPIDELKLKPPPGAQLPRGAVRRFGQPRIHFRGLLFGMGVDGDDRLYAVTGRGGTSDKVTLQAFNPQTGRVIFEIAMDRHHWATDPSWRHVIYCPEFEGSTIFLLDLRSARRLPSLRPKPNLTCTGFPWNNNPAPTIAEGRIAAPLSPREIGVWELNTGRLLRRFRLPRAMRNTDSLALTRDGQVLLLPGTPHAWHVDSGRKVPIAGGDVVESVATSHKSPVALVLYKRAGPKLLDLRKGRLQTPRWWSQGIARAHLDPPSGRILTIAKRIRVHDTLTGKQLVDLAAGLPKLRARLFASGSRLAVSSERRIQIYRMSDARLIHDLKLPTHTKQFLSPKPECDLIYVMRNDQVALVVDPLTGHRISLADYSDGLDDLCAVTKQHVFIGDLANKGADIRRWSRATGREVPLPLVPPKQRLDELSMHPSGRVFASVVEGSLELHSLPTGRLIKRIPAEKGQNSQGQYSCMSSPVFSAEGQSLGYYHGEQLVRLSLRSGATIAMPKKLRCQAALASSRQAWACGDDGAVHLFSRRRHIGSLKRKIYPERLAFDASGRYLAVSSSDAGDTRVLVVDVKGWKVLWADAKVPSDAWQIPQCGPVWSRARKLAVGDNDVLRIWPDARKPRHLDQHLQGRCLGLAYTADESLLVVIKPDGKPPEIWRLRSPAVPRRLMVLPVPEQDIRPLVFSPRRRYLLTTEQRSAMLLWRLP